MRRPDFHLFSWSLTYAIPFEPSATRRQKSVPRDLREAAGMLTPGFGCNPVPVEAVHVF